MGGTLPGRRPRPGRSAGVLTLRTASGSTSTSTTSSSSQGAVHGALAAGERVGQRGADAGAAMPRTAARAGRCGPRRRRAAGARRRRGRPRRSSHGRSQLTTTTVAVGTAGHRERREDPAERALAGMFVVDDVEAERAEAGRGRRRRPRPDHTRRRAAPRRHAPPSPAPSTSTSALSRPIRVLRPPHSTTPSGTVQPGRAGRVELGEEQGDALGLVGLADRRGHLAEAAQAAEEATVRRVGPAHVARAAPAVGPQRVEPAVVADPVGGVALHRVPPGVAERPPGGQRPGMGGDDGGHRVVAARPVPRAASAATTASSSAGSTVRGGPDEYICTGWSVTPASVRTPPAVAVVSAPATSRAGRLPRSRRPRT